jgi:hypothetical protein
MKNYKGIMPAFVHPPQGVPQPFMASMVKSYRAGVFQHFYTGGTSGRLNKVRTENGKVFLESDAEWIFYVDTDMIWEPEAIITLRQFAEKQKIKAVSGWALLIKDGIWPHAIRTEDNKYTTWGMIEPGSDPIQVDAVGGACFLVHREAMEAVRESSEGEYKWQDEIYNDTLGLNVGEDIVFSERIRDAGYDIWYHPGAIFGHVKPTIFGPTEYLRFQQRLQERVNAKLHAPNL